MNCKQDKSRNFPWMILSLGSEKITHYSFQNTSSSGESNLFCLKYSFGHDCEIEIVSSRIYQFKNQESNILETIKDSFQVWIGFHTDLLIWSFLKIKKNLL
jgi:hypothetical protein